LGLGVRVAWWVIWIQVIESDGTEYARIAQSLFEGQGLVGIFGGVNTAFPPFYPLLIGALSYIIGDLELAGRLISLTAGVGLIAVLYLLTKQLFDHRSAVLAGLLAALHPVLIALSVSVFSESLSTFLVMLGALCAIRTMQQLSLRRASATGVAFGTACLTRPEAIAFAAVASAAIFCSLIRTRQYSPRVLTLAVLPLIFATIIGAPYSYYLSHLAGRFTWEGKSSVVHVLSTRMRVNAIDYSEASHGLTPSGAKEGPYLFPDQLVYLRNPPRTLFQTIRDVARAAPGRALRAAQTIWGGRNIGLGGRLLVVAIFLGLFGTRWWRRDVLGGFLFLVFGVMQCATLLTVEYHFARYFLPLVSVGIPWTAAGLVAIEKGAAALGKRHFPAFPITNGLLAVAGALLIIVSSLRDIPNVYELNETRSVAIKKAAEWIVLDRGRLSGHNDRPVVMGHSAAVVHYANARFSLLPYAPPDLALRYIHEVMPDYIVIGGNERSQAPYLRDWFVHGIADPCARLVFEVSPSVGPAMKVWRWGCRSSRFAPKDEPRRGDNPLAG
jgi:4-amino-4-deoxy-L-arabinose transferase-like glycosyltransferase